MNIRVIQEELVAIRGAHKDSVYDYTQLAEVLRRRLEYSFTNVRMRTYDKTRFNEIGWRTEQSTLRPLLLSFRGLTEMIIFLRLDEVVILESL